jgi:tRNA threonylcarbamoyladenosine biosynthesis protein TsaB
MKVLAFDTALGACSAAVLADGEMASRRFEPRLRGHAEALVPMIEDVRREAGIPFEDFDLFAVTVGPGTFTGLRIGLATARGLSLAAGVPLAGVTTLHAIAAGASGAAGEDILVALDARRAQVYAQLFEAVAHEVANPVGHPAALAVDGAGALLRERPAVVVGSGAPLVLDVLGAGKGQVRCGEAGAEPDAAVIARLALRQGLPARGAPPPAPLYLRPPDAKLPS